MRGAIGLHYSPTPSSCGICWELLSDVSEKGASEGARKSSRWVTAAVGRQVSIPVSVDEVCDDGARPRNNLRLNCAARTLLCRNSASLPPAYVNARSRRLALPNICHEGSNDMASTRSSKPLAAISSFDGSEDAVASSSDSQSSIRISCVGILARFEHIAVVAAVNYSSFVRRRRVSPICTRKGKREEYVKMAEPEHKKKLENVTSPGPGP